MVQARRASRTGRSSPGAVLLAGSYSFEQKVTVEWERELAVDEFGGLLSPLLAEPRTFAAIRAYISGALKGCDPALPPGKVSRYRVSGRSLRQALDAMVAAGRLASAELPGSGIRVWSRR